jgi:hypothetical protein
VSEGYSQNAPSVNGIERGVPDVPEARRNLVSQILKDVDADKKRWDKAFKRMAEDAAFVRKQLPGETANDDRIKVNIIQRHINQRVASLYAKNPTFIAERRQRMDFSVWDGTRASMERATQTMASGVMDPDTMELLGDVQQGITRQRMLDNVGRTMQILLQYAVDEQQPPFKPQCKQVVRRAVTRGVGYIEIQFQRQLSKRPETEARLSDITDRLAQIEQLYADAADKIIADDTQAEVERLRLAEEALQAEKEIIVREGLVFDFPRPSDIIPDRNCWQLAVGFPGARRVSKKFLLTIDQIKQVYSVDVGSSYTKYSAAGETPAAQPADADCRACVYEVYDRIDGLMYAVCEGYTDFLKDPTAPPLAYIEPFFPFFPLIFNPTDDDEDIYPESDVRLLMPIQREFNRKREAVRQHRIASRPLYAARKGALGGEDAKTLAGHAAHDVVELEGLADGEAVDKAFQPFPKVGVDPNLYETGTDLTDMQLVVGAQEANLGGTSGDSATENSIAESSRLQSLDSNIDDLDDWFTSIARAAGQVLLHEMSLETVQAVAGPGAVWPELSPSDIAEEVFLKIQAGSSGRPNKAQDLANLERATPVLVQVPGINPEWLAKHTLRTLDAHIDLEEAFTAGLPSITSMNRQPQMGTGDPATDPNQQGGAGGDNAPQENNGKGGAQPSYSADAAGPDGGAANMM